jgi:hypothetical protein
MGNATQSSLWRMISQVDGLSEWFADEVLTDIAETTYTFVWGKASDKAAIVSKKVPSCIRFQWIDEDDKNIYFEFLIHRLDLTGKMALEIVDFAEPDEKNDAIALWESQVEKMKKRLGVFF